MNRTLVIAEAGVNHNGDIKLAKQLVDVAAQSGADFVKFQTFCAERIVTKNAKGATYQLQASDLSESQFDLLKRLELSEEAHYELIEHCKKRSIAFLSSGFDKESVSFLDNIGQEIFKIPSGEITNVPLLRHVGSMKKPVILSSGMASMEEIKFALDTFRRVGLPRKQVTVLHCTTEYPAPFSEVNLRAMVTIGRTFGVSVGYSDHTQGIEVAIAAVALGATIIEKHFTTDRSLPGPDHKASLEPHELRAMITAIRNIEISLGSTLKEPTQSEFRNLHAVRKSIVALRPIGRGEVFSELNLTVKRPGGGISPTEWDNVIGKVATRDYYPDEEIDK